MDGDDYTYEVHGEIPGVSALAGRDPAEDIQRERLAMRETLVELRYQLLAAQRATAQALSLIDEALI